MADVLNWTIWGIELAGVLVIVGGFVWTVAVWLARFIGRSTGDATFHFFRARVGRSIILGLEFLVAADIIKTVTIDPTLRGLAVLGALVVIRTFLSFALEVETEGRWPWQRGSE